MTDAEIIALYKWRHFLNFSDLECRLLLHLREGLCDGSYLAEKLKRSKEAVRTVIMKITMKQPRMLVKAQHKKRVHYSLSPFGCRLLTEVTARAVD